MECCLLIGGPLHQTCVQREQPPRTITEVHSESWDSGALVLLDYHRTGEPIESEYGRTQVYRYAGDNSADEMSLIEIQKLVRSPRDWNNCYVVADPDAMRLWNFFDTRRQAEACLQGISPRYNDCNWQVMLFTDYDKQKRAKLLNQPVTETTREGYDYALGVVPPLRYCSTTVNGEYFASFMLGECYTDTFYSQHVHYRNRYFSKLADIKDKTTWITAEELDDFISANPNPTVPNEESQEIDL